MKTTKYPSLTPEAVAAARELIGVPLRRRQHYTEATRDVLLRWAKGLGDRNPLYTDLSYGTLNTPWATLVGHPTSLFVFDHTFVAPKLPGVHAIYGGLQMEWFRQVRAGDRITATAMVTAVEEKEGAFCGPMVLQEGEVRYENQWGEVVAVARPRILRTPRDAARERGKYAGLMRYKYSTDEFEAIIAGYQAEEYRGSKPRYWEEVQIGEVLPEVVKGPLTTEDMLFYVGEINETLFYKYFVDHMRRHPADVYWHPDTNMPDTWDSSFLLDAVAQEFGFPGAHDTGLQRISWIECMIVNWMGDVAMLRQLDIRLTRPFLLADTAWLRGLVISKSFAGGHPVVQLEVRCENQRGEVTAHGTAQVELPSSGFAAIQPGLIMPREDLL